MVLSIAPLHHWQVGQAFLFSHKTQAWVASLPAALRSTSSVSCRASKDLIVECRNVHILPAKCALHDPVENVGALQSECSVITWLWHTWFCLHSRWRYAAPASMNKNIVVRCSCMNDLILHATLLHNCHMNHEIWPWVNEWIPIPNSLCTHSVHLSTNLP